MALSGANALEVLRARVRELEGTHVVTRQVETGVEVMDRHLGGLPQPGIVEVCGAPGGGRTRLALALVAAATQRREPVAWVDLARDLYPPALAQHGAVARRVLIVRPTQDRAIWAVEQLLRAGSFSLVVVTGLGSVGRAGHRWSRAVELGACTVVVVRDHPDRRIPATLRLAVDRGRLVVTRDRRGGGALRAEVAPLPAWPAQADPWI